MYLLDNCFFFFLFLFPFSLFPFFGCLSTVFLFCVCSIIKSIGRFQIILEIDTAVGNTNTFPYFSLPCTLLTYLLATYSSKYLPTYLSG